ncbi:MAG TPA: hypothetical protein VHV49_21670 [Pseudonocardiaceae bacterium]|jgi:hypothetical protein|nr:hypothetical protein [Pseudonocardiaceae bacterium]
MSQYEPTPIFDELLRQLPDLPGARFTPNVDGENPGAANGRSDGETGKPAGQHAAADRSVE